MSGYVDLQVNGYAGVDFNGATLTVDQAIRVSRRLADDGVEQILPTIITAPLQTMVARITRIVDLLETVPEFAKIVAGLHVEGPFINPADGFVGAHPSDAVVPATVDTADRLLDAGRGRIALVTLAPEMDEGAIVTSHLAQKGIIVAAGHSDASMTQLHESIDAGLRLFTHLGNGCPSMLNRHDNIVQRVLSLSDRLMISFIADGHHVPAYALGNYLRGMPDENVIIVTDAISAAGLGPGRYELAGQIVEVDEDGAAWAAGRAHFAGCAATFPEMIRVLREDVGIDPEKINCWIDQNPRRLLSLAVGH